MIERVSSGRIMPVALIALTLLLLAKFAAVESRAGAGAVSASPVVQGGRGGGGGQQAPQTPQAAAPIDLTGYWVSLVTEDWRWRMLTPPKGDYESVPLTPAARAIADAWDPLKDQAAGEQCKAYGAPSVMRLPGVFHITWADPNTLKVEVDNGQQTREFKFAAAGARGAPGARGGATTQPANAPRTWQGNSVAVWENAGGRGAQGAGNLRVVTTGMRAGYLRKNGIPYSENAVVTEYFYRILDEGTSYLHVVTLIQDPQFLNGDWIKSSSFKLLPDGSTFSPTPCTAQ